MKCLHLLANLLCISCHMDGLPNDSFFFFQSPPRPLPSVPLQPSPSFRLAQGNLGRNADGREHTERCCQKKILLESVREDFIQNNRKEKKQLCMGTDWLEALACVQSRCCWLLALFPKQEKIK